MLLALLWGAAALAQEPEIDFRGAIQGDLRFALPRTNISPFYDRTDPGPGIARNQLAFLPRLSASVGRFAMKARIDVVLPGYPRDVDTLDALTDRRAVGPVYFEANELFIEARDVPAKGFDIRVGNQVIDWGAGDRFNPTNTFNANDVEDVLLFGEQIGNFMVRLDWNPTWWLQFNAVAIPVFQPALVPQTAPLALTAVDRLPWYDEELRLKVQTENALAKDRFGYPVIVAGTEVQLPEASPGNMQFGFRAAALAGPVDVSLSYYRGFSDTPVPVANYTSQTPGEKCHPTRPGKCIEGTLDTTIVLGFPRMQVVGLNVAGEGDPLGWIPTVRPIGFRAEVALIVPEEQRITIEQTEDITFEIAPGFPITQPAGEYDYTNGERPVVVDGRPFAKWVVGLDYTLTKSIYFNGQWVHGFPGEFGAGDFIQPGYSVMRGGVTTDPDGTLGCVVFDDSGEKCARELLRHRLGDYVIAGLDTKLLSQQLLVRLFGILDVTGAVSSRWSEDEQARVVRHHGPFSRKAFSAVVYPEIQYNLGNGLELHGGLLLQLGHRDTRFGDPATGGSMVFTRARYSF